MGDLPLYTRDSLPTHPDGWTEWRKRTLTPAMRIIGPFQVETDEGRMECADGWLAIDSRGFPYPIDATEFQTIYEPAEES